MSDFTMAQAKRDFSRGLLDGVRVVNIGMGLGWTVIIRSRLGMDGAGYLVDARSKEPRKFRTADAAIAAVEQIGFRVYDMHIKSA